MTPTNININDILAFHFAGERLTDEQEIYLADWVSQNKKEYRRLTEFFHTTRTSERMIFNAKLAWTKVNKKISASPEASAFTRLRRFLPYAACTLILCCMFLYFMNTGGNDRTLFCNTTEKLQTVMLPDSSSVTLYPHSKIWYTDNAERKVKLEGKAFFKVRAKTEQPFTVHTWETTICVLGTSFLVDGEDKAETKIFVRDGIVQVSTAKNEVILKRDEQALSDGQEIVKSRVENSELLFKNHIKQKTYKNMPLSQVISDIEEEFKIQIIYTESIKNAKINTKLKFINIEEILSEISYICNIKYRKTGDKRFELYAP